MYKTAAGDRYQLLKGFARENRKNPTLAEKTLWNCLRDKALGVKFLRQHILGDYIGDFVATDIKLVIEVDGGYHSQYLQQQKDNDRSEFISNMGYEVVRFSNEEIVMNTDSVIRQIKEIIKQKQ